MTYDTIISEYSDVFDGGLGFLPGDYHIAIDDTVTPIQHHPRKVAVALKVDLKNKLQELEEKGVID